MKKFVRYEFCGIVVDIPLVYYEKSGKWLEQYPDFAENPVYTKDGMPLMLCIEDACKYAVPIDKDRLVACSDCSCFVRAADKALFGYCTNEMNKKK